MRGGLFALFYLLCINDEEKSRVGVDISQFQSQARS